MSEFSSELRRVIEADLSRYAKAWIEAYTSGDHELEIDSETADISAVRDFLVVAYSSQDPDILIDGLAGVKRPPVERVGAGIHLDWALAPVRIAADAYRRAISDANSDLRQQLETGETTFETLLVNPQNNPRSADAVFAQLGPVIEFVRENLMAADTKLESPKIIVGSLDRTQRAGIVEPIQMVFTAFTPVLFRNSGNSPLPRAEQLKLLHLLVSSNALDHGHVEALRLLGKEHWRIEQALASSSNGRRATKRTSPGPDLASDLLNLGRKPIEVADFDNERQMLLAERDVVDDLTSRVAEAFAQACRRRDIAFDESALSPEDMREAAGLRLYCGRSPLPGADDWDNYVGSVAGVALNKSAREPLRRDEIEVDRLSTLEIINTPTKPQRRVELSAEPIGFGLEFG